MEKINFKNLPDTSTPINAENLNQIQANIENAINGIVESGSNANGTWIKFSDGTMIIRQEYTSSAQNTTVTMGSLKRVGISVPPDFPVSFIEPPNVQITLHNCWLGWLIGCEYEPTTTNATNGTYIPIASAEQRSFEAIKINILAVGKWK